MDELLNEPMSASLREAVERAFLAVHAGRSTDDVVIDPDLNDAFLNECRKLTSDVDEFEANWQLLNLRKASSLGKVTTDVRRFSHGDYQHASQIAARQLENRFEITVDRILCDPLKRKEFDHVARSVTADVSLYRLRKAALGLYPISEIDRYITSQIALQTRDETGGAK